MKKYAIIALILALAVLPLSACGHHHGGGSVPPSPTPNPAAYAYTARVVAQHQPGFFSCANHNDRLFMGTYQDYNHKGHCQLCILEGNRVNVLHTFPGESIYNLRSYQGFLIMPCEQGALWRRNDDNTYMIIHGKHLHMGHYDFAWAPGGWVTSEKEGITALNRSQLWKNGSLLLEKEEVTWKEFVVLGDKIYVAAYFIHKHTEGGLLEVNANTGESRLLYSQPGTACYTIGLYNGQVYYGLQHGNSTTIRTLQGPIQEIPDIAWRIRAVGDTLFLTAAEHGWRKGGPSYLYVFNPQSGQFEKKLQIPDAEPWDICAGPAGNQFYLVTRNENGNLGRVYLVERH